MTPQRYQRIREILDRRQPDLTVLLENVHKPHNFAAVARTCDAVGILDAHAVYPEGRMPTRLAAGAGVERWLRLHDHPDLDAAIARLRGEGLTLVAAHPAPRAVDFRQVDLTRPTAIVLGQEKDGLTRRALEEADTVVSIPMHGAGRSLNVSVAAALILFEAQRQRAAAGMYERPRLPAETFDRLLFEWGYPRIAARCREQGVPYPRLGERGEPLGPYPAAPPRE